MSHFTPEVPQDLCATMGLGVMMMTVAALVAMTFLSRS